MFPIYTLFLLQNETIKENMEVDFGDFAYIVITLISVGVAYGVLQGKQKEMERRIDALEAMINNQINVDNGIRDVLTKLEVGQAAMTEQIKNLVDRLNKYES